MLGFICSDSERIQLTRSWMRGLILTVCCRAATTPQRNLFTGNQREVVMMECETASHLQAADVVAVRCMPLFSLLEERQTFVVWYVDRFQSQSVSGLPQLHSEEAYLNRVGTAE